MDIQILELEKSYQELFDLITAHTNISAQSSNSIVFRLQPVYFLKANVVGTHLNCIDIDAIQMGTHNICFYKENHKDKTTQNYRIVII